MDDKIKQLGKLLSSVPDYKKLITSAEYTAVSFENPELAQSLLCGKSMKLKGDLRTITVGGFGKVWLMVTLDNVSYAPQREFRVVVTVPDWLKDEVMKLKPDTNVELLVVYTKEGLPVESFELVEVLSTSDELNFPYCICTGNNDKNCHASLGYTLHERDTKCPVCGSKTALVYNVYTEEARKMLGLSSIKEV